MNVKLKSGIIYVVLGVILLLFVIVLSGTLYLVFKPRGKYSDNQRTPYEYQYSRYNPHTNETTGGFVSFYEKLKDEDFVSVEDVDGSLILISHHEMDEFRCTGSCVCNDQRRRTASVPVVRQGVMFLVAAISSLLAYSKAKEYLQAECDDDEDIFKDCEDVIANLEGCYRYIGPNIELDEPVIEDKKDIRRYYCKGHCLDRRKVEDEENLRIFRTRYERYEEYPIFAEKLNDFSTSCDEYVMENEVKFNCYLESGSMTESAAKMFVQKKFIRFRMREYCAFMSRVDYEWLDPGYIEPPKILSDYACISDVHGENHSIMCRRLS